LLLSSHAAVIASPGPHLHRSLPRLLRTKHCKLHIVNLQLQIGPAQRTPAQRVVRNHAGGDPGYAICNCGRLPCAFPDQTAPPGACDPKRCRSTAFQSRGIPRAETLRSAAVARSEDRAQQLFGCFSASWSIFPRPGVDPSDRTIQRRTPCCERRTVPLRIWAELAEA